VPIGIVHQGSCGAKDADQWSDFDKLSRVVVGGQTSTSSVEAWSAVSGQWSVVSAPRGICRAGAWRSANHCRVRKTDESTKRIWDRIGLGFRCGMQRLRCESRSVLDLRFWITWEAVWFACDRLRFRAKADLFKTGSGTVVRSTVRAVPA